MGGCCGKHCKQRSKFVPDFDSKHDAMEKGYEVIDLTEDDEEHEPLAKKRKVMVNLKRCTSCTFLNDEGSSICSVCSSNLDGEQTIEELGIECQSCIMVNEAGTKVCQGCQEPLEPSENPECSPDRCSTSTVAPSSLSLKDSISRKCPVCTMLNGEKAEACDACGTPLVIEDAVNGALWKPCPECTFLNPSDSKTCSCCQSPMVGGLKNSTGSFRENGEEVQIQWVCPECTLSNHIKTKICQACQTRRPAEFRTPTKDTKAEELKGSDSAGYGEIQAFMLKAESRGVQTDGLVQLLEKCYTAPGAAGGWSSYKTLTWRLCSPATHITQRHALGSRWSCGYRNIQMLCKALMQRPEYRKVLFDGRTQGQVPGIYALQGWLERAWHLGFDTAGAVFFDGKVTGGNKWIGATECVTLLRSFGVRAQVVDFDQSFSKMLNKSGIRSRKARQRSILEYMSKEQEYRENVSDLKSPAEENKLKPELQRMLMEWVWKYFDPNCHPSKNSSRIYKGVQIRPEEKWPEDYLPPLYFQHQGHSRTIIGMEKGVKKGKNAAEALNLLVFDPAQVGYSIQYALSIQKGWARYLKRGVHTLKKNAYQIVYIQPGIMTEQEIEASKKLKADGPFNLINPDSDFVSSSKSTCNKPNLK